MMKSFLVGEVLIILVGVLLSSITIYFAKLLLSICEDRLKINFDTDALLELYKGAPEYKQKLILNGTEKTIAYNAILTDGSGTFTVDDHETNEFQLDPFILENYDRLFAAHSSSTKINALTIRMDDYDAKERTFKLSRSTYFNHLVTNRAIDFELFEEVSLRNVYEYGPTLTPLAKSKMSNHVGINGLVFLKGKYLLIPRRKFNATISKNKITSSIATMLKFPKGSNSDLHSIKITKKHLFYDNIVDSLTDRVKIKTYKSENKSITPNGESADNTIPLNDNIIVSEDKIDVRFLGFGRNIYEGGKPQMYFAVNLDITVEEFWANHQQCIKELKNDKDTDYRLDQDRCIYVAKWNSLKLKKDNMFFEVLNKKGTKTRRIKSECEFSYLCNLWHYIEADTPFHPKNNKA